MQKWFSPFVLGYILIYVANFVFAFDQEGFPLKEAFGIAMIVGLCFSLVAYVVSRKALPLIEEQPAQRKELLVLAGLVAYLTVSIVVGNKSLDWLLPSSLLDEGHEQSTLSLFREVITFVIIPFMVYRKLYGFRPHDFGLSVEWRKVFSARSAIIFAVMAAVVLGLNYFGGSAAKPIRDGVFSVNQLLIAIPLLFIWDYIEVGLVEEFFFRGLLQNRLAVVLRSPWGAIFVSALIFGLVHAPGMYLRGAGVIEGLGKAPSLFFCVSYCIAVQSAAGIFFGIIWYKTRNLWLLMGIHAMMDLLPHLAEFIGDWGL